MRKSPEEHRHARGVKNFFLYAREREKIRQKKERGEPQPWTDDPVLREYRFCNIFREDDRTTRWFRENIREPLRDDPVKVFIATAAFRWFNRVETGELIKDILLKNGWNGEAVWGKLHGVSPLVTGAYVIKTPDGMQKLTGIIWCMERLISNSTLLNKVHSHKNMTMEQLWNLLIQVPYLGAFMAYEIVTDLRYTCVLENADDKMTWANPGPGAIRGWGWVEKGDPGAYSQSRSDKARVLQGIIHLLVKSMERKFWPPQWGNWEAREVEHTLCEYDKWRRGHAGQRLKRLYNART